MRVSGAEQDKVGGDNAARLHGGSVADRFAALKRFGSASVQPLRSSGREATQF
jgi:hypothetical protein